MKRPVFCRQWLMNLYHWTWLGSTVASLSTRPNTVEVLVQAAILWAGGIVFITIGSMIPFWIPGVMGALPKSSQRYYYGLFKQHVLGFAAESHPLVSYPLTVYVELELDEEFEKGGYRGATKAVDHWIDTFISALRDC